MADFNLNVLLAEEKSYLVSDSSLSLVDDRSFIRVWRKIPPIALEAALAVLRARRTETNPKTDLKTFSGIYRIQNCSHKLDLKSEEGQIYEQLALGLITTLQEFAAGYDSTVSPDTDVRLVTARVYPQTDTAEDTEEDPNNAVLQLVRVWRYVDPTKTDDIILALRTVKTETNPVASGQVYTGTYSVGRAWSERAADGSDDIFQELNINLLTNFDETYAENCKNDVRIIEQEGLSKAGLETFLLDFQRATYTAGVNNSISIGYDKVLGLYSVSVRQRIGVVVTQTQYQSDASAAANAVEDKVYNSPTAAPLDMTRVAGQIIRGDVSLNENCLYDKVRKIETVEDQTGDVVDSDAERVIAVIKHTEKDDTVTLPAHVSGVEGIVEPGIVASVSNDPTQAGKMRTTQTLTQHRDISTPVTAKDGGGSLVTLYTSIKADSYIGKRSDYKNQVVEPVLTESRGTLVKAINSNGTWNGVKIVKTTDNDVLVGWPEEIHGFTIWKSGVKYPVIVFRAYFGTIHGAELYVATIHSPALTSSGIPEAIEDYVSSSDNWVISGNEGGNYTTIDRINAALYRATRVEIYLTT